MNNAAGAAQGVRREIDTLVKSQVERVLNDMGVVKSRGASRSCATWRRRRGKRTNGWLRAWMNSSASFQRGAAKKSR
jgi:hypothetical protein